MHTLQIGPCAESSAVACDDADEEGVIVVKGIPHADDLAGCGKVDAVELFGAVERHEHHLILREGDGEVLEVEGL